jgi:D-alanyl-D-alanine carboxypeptidase
VVAGAAMACCLVTSGAVPASASPNREPSTGLSRALLRLVSMPGGPPGAIALVQVGGHTQVTTAGVGNIVTNAPISPGDTVRIASVSKAFSGAVALALVTRGRLSLDDTIAQRLPYLPKTWGRVTLGQLLQHTSGLPDYIKSTAFLDLLKPSSHPSSCSATSPTSARCSRRAAGTATRTPTTSWSDSWWRR